MLPIANRLTDEKCYMANATNRRGQRCQRLSRQVGVCRSRYSLNEFEHCTVGCLGSHFFFLSGIASQELFVPSAPPTTVDQKSSQAVNIYYLLDRL